MTKEYIYEWSDKGGVMKLKLSGCSQEEAMNEAKKWGWTPFKQKKVWITKSNEYLLFAVWWLFLGFLIGMILKVI